MQFGVGKAIGFVVGFAFFCTILTFAIALTRHTTPNPTIPILIAVCASIVGYSLQRWLA